MKSFILLLLFLPIFEDFKNDEIEIVDDEEKSIIIITGNLMCHKCFETLNRRILNINEKNRNFNYYILLDSDRGIVKRKKLIEVYTKKAKPNNYVFMTSDSIYKKFLQSKNIEDFPTILLINNGKMEIVLYRKIFNKKNNEIRIIDSLLKELNNPS